MTATEKKVLISLLFCALPATAAQGQAVLFRDDFSRAEGPMASSDWSVQAGALTAVDGAAWTGVPEGASGADVRVLAGPDAVADAAVSFQLYNQGLVSDAQRPPAAHDGVHVWLRYRDAENLYAVSVARRDGMVRIQKKAAGRYYDLASPQPLPAGYNRWQRVTVAAQDGEEGAVKISAYVAGRLVASAVDDGVGGPALSGAGRVGLRGDNCRFLLDDFTVTSLGGSR
jgi:hypothetical protein